MMSPVIQRASSEARNAITEATSSGLPDALERLHAHHGGAAVFGLGEVRHVGVDHAGRDRVDADAARAERRGEIFHQRVDGALGARVGGQRADRRARAERGQETMLLPSPRIGSNCCTRN